MISTNIYGDGEKSRGKVENWKLEIGMEVIVSKVPFSFLMPNGHSNSKSEISSCSIISRRLDLLISFPFLFLCLLIMENCLTSPNRQSYVNCQSIHKSQKHPFITWSHHMYINMCSNLFLTFPSFNGPKSTIMVSTDEYMHAS